MSNNTITINNVTSIFYGFLIGNLLSGAEGNYDERASAESYASMLRTELTAAYPGTEIEIDYQIGAEGCLPATLKPRVALADGSMEESGDRGEIEHIEGIASRVWESFSWAVEVA